MAKGRVAALLVAVGSLAGAAAVWRRRSGRDAERVDVYFGDGSMVSFAQGSEEAARALPIARRVLWQARS